MDNQGWIKIHRKLLDWEWIDNSTILWVFIKCLLLANYKDKQWHGITIKKGSFITSYENLASKKAHISVQMVRTAIKHLKLTGEITSETNYQYTIITIQNYIDYQEITSDITNDKQAINKRLTTTNNIKNNKNIKKYNTNSITKKSYGNKDINFLIGYLKEKLKLPILDETEQTNRRYCWLALKKFGGVDKIKLLIDATVQNEFWSTKITSFKTLYYKGINIISSGRDMKFRPTEIKV